MAIRPVDMAIIQRSADATQIRQNEINKPMTDQVNFQQQTQKDIRTRAETVGKKDNPDNQGNNPDAKEKGRGLYYGDEPGKHGKPKEQVVLKKKGGLDIKI